MTAQYSTTNPITKITGSVWHFADSWLVRLKTDDFRDYSFKFDNHMSNVDQVNFWATLRDWFNSNCTLTQSDEVRESGCFHGEGIFEITTKIDMQYAMPQAFEIFEWATGVIGKWTLDQITNNGQEMPHQYITAEKEDGRIKVYICKDGAKLANASSHDVMNLIKTSTNAIIYPSPAISDLENQIFWGRNESNRTKYLGSIGSREPWVKAWYWSNILRANAENSHFGWLSAGVAEETILI